MRSILPLLFGVLAYLIGMNCFFKNNPKPTFEELSKPIQEWFRMGKTVEINGRKMFYIVKKCKNPQLKNKPTFALIHGFPSSSFEYHKVLDKLSAHGDVILNDHIGFGFSECPVENYTYSLGEAAENILALWRYLGIEKAHVVSHDMGDSILTEILARRYRGMLPQHFDNFFQSVTFTNGGMNFKMINMRIGQSILMHKRVGQVLQCIVDSLGVRRWILTKQLQGIWSPSANQDERDRDLEDLMDLNTYTGAGDIVGDTIFYLWDRYHFEFRWFAALKELDIPSRFIWGDSDSVAPASIARSFETMVPNFDLTVLKGLGHFWMLEAPDVWVSEITKILEKF